MAFHHSLAIWIAVKFEERKGSITTIDELHQCCRNLNPVPTKDVIAKIVALLFNAQPLFLYQNSERTVAYPNIKVRSHTQVNQISLPRYCKLISLRQSELKFQCPLTTVIDGRVLNWNVTVNESDTIISIRKYEFKCGFVLNISQSKVDGILLALHSFKLCHGVPFQETLPKTFYQESLSKLHDENSVRSIGRSKSCKTLLSLFGKTDACQTCSDSYNKFKKRKESCSKPTAVISPSAAKKPRQSHFSSDPKPNSCCEEPNNEEVEDVLNPTIDLSDESHSDMVSLLSGIIEEGSAPDFKLLLESQLRNCKQGLDARQRRWDPKVISICLGLLLKSPQAYQNLKESGVLVLPSRRLLQYYKNIVKQHPGFNDQNLIWMKNESNRQNVSVFGHRGGILIDEMTIQDDLVITKSGDRWNIVGMVDMGETNNSIKIITNGKKKIEMATHVLQFVFHGFTGFRWPVVYFGSNTATAHELYTTFWDCVDKLDDKGFIVDYVNLDGASTNRSFINMLMHNPRASKFVFQDIFDHNHSICAIQDIMHVFKKVRNNVESSCVENTNKSGRYLKLSNVPIVWDHWKECFAFNFQNGFAIHKSLTEEHIELTPASKMRNHLATQVLNKEMLYLMKSYQRTLTDPERLSSSILFLENTSELVSFFCDHNRPISTLADERLEILRKTLDFFNGWENDVKRSKTLSVKKNLMTEETRDDINSSLSGFLSLSQLTVKNGNSINPGYLNSDLIENFFCQQRGIRNGLNTNPTLAQYGPSNTAIILGQHAVSNKANSGRRSIPFNGVKPLPLNPQQNKASISKRRSIRI